MRRRRILHVIPTLDQSGAEKQLALLATHLPTDPFEVHICALTRGGYYEAELQKVGIQVHVLHKRLKADPMTLWRLRGLMKDFQPDIVQTWLFAGNCYGRIAARWARVPVIIASERCVDTWKVQHQFALDRWLARWTNAVAVNSGAVARFYQKVGIPAEKLRVIPNAVEPICVTNAMDRKNILKEIGVDSDCQVIGVIGRLWPQKRVQDVIWAVDILRLGGWDLKLLIVGDGPRRPALERFAHNLEIDDLVHFLGHRADAREIVQAIDMLVIASQFEGMPNTVLEAMQAGKPVVATRIAGMDEVVVDGETGLLVEPKQPVELAKAISKLLTAQDLCRQMGQAGQIRAKELFSIERMVDGYASLYEELCPL